MARKILKFSVHKLIIDGKNFDFSDFVTINDGDVEKEEITHRDERGTEMLSAKKISKAIIFNRFITLYFLEGEKFPYSDIIIDPDLKERKNPRTPSELELDKQFFVVLDVKNQKIYLSDSKKKYYFISWLDKMTGKHTEIKSILSESDFVEKIKSISGISFTIEPTLFNSIEQDVLSKRLVDDIYGFGADSAKVELHYKQSKLTAAVIEKVKSLLQNKSEFKEITVIGRSDENFENIFNLDEIVSKILIEVTENPDSKLLNDQEVFTGIIERITANEKTN